MANSSDSSHVFEKEVEILERSQKLLTQENTSRDGLLKEYSTLTNSYAQLLEETRLITRVSDRLQNKINRANDKLSNQAEKINNINEELQKNNKSLKMALEQLTKAKVSNKTTTIVLVFAIMLFFISEGFIEPIVDKGVDSIWMGLLFKGLIFLLLKPIEMVVEKYLERKASGKDKIAEELLG